MSADQDHKTANAPQRFSTAAKDLLILAIVTLAVLALSYFFDVFTFLIRFLERHPDSIAFVDEIVFGLLTISIGFGVFSWRRLQELKKETTERIRLERELVDAAATKAEIERIISKQLRSELEVRKQAERDTSNHQRPYGR